MKIKTEYLFCFFTAIIVCVFFAHTLNYPWKHFDEQIIYSETIFPIPALFSQIFEYLKYFGLHNYFEASNPFYSTISNIRCDPVATLITLFVYFFFQKNAFAYHTLSLFLHILNTGLLFLILNKISLNYNVRAVHELPQQVITRLFLVSILTLIWALHPTNVESILFTTNWAAILGYFLCLVVIYYFLSLYLETTHTIKNIPWHAPGILLVLYLIPLFNTEYSITVPLILFFYTFATSNFQNSNISFLQSISYSLKRTLPLFFALGVFVLYFFFSRTKENIHLSTENPIQTTIERISWLSPQIFFHFVKLILFPVHLSIDQTAMVELSKSFLEPYSLFCTAFMYLITLMLFFSFLYIKNQSSFFFFISFSPFLIALLPFLHLISPTYCLSSERYLYFPLAMLIFGISHLVFYIFSNFSKRGILWHAPTITILISLLLTFGIRTYIRTLDWKDSESLFASALKVAPNNLFKALRVAMLGSLYSTKDQIKGTQYLNEAARILEKSLIKLEKEKQKYQAELPEIIRIYGLDPKTIQAKTAYLLVSTKLGLDLDIKNAYEILKPYMEDLTVIDTQVLDLYLGLLFSTNNLNEAEIILNHALNKKLSPTLLIITSELYKRKYNDLAKAELYLKKSFKYFPYDIQTLEALRNLYFTANNPEEFAFFSYLYGIRMHSKESLENAYKVYMKLNNKKMAKLAYNNLVLLNK